MKEESIESLKREVRKLRKLAYFDELTGLLNRRGFKDMIQKFSNQISREKEGRRKKVKLSSLSIALIDLDHFKKVNDTYGHDAGDAALKHITKIILGRVRDLDVVGRWGGEELIVGLVGADESDSVLVLDSIRERLAGRTLNFQRKKISFTLSAGVACFDGGSPLDEVVAMADKALYKAKHSGRNKVIKFSDLPK